MEFHNFSATIMSIVERSYLSRKDVCLRYSLSRSSLYRSLREGRFPQPVKIAGGPRTLRWSVRVLEEFELAGCVVRLGEPTDNFSQVDSVSAEFECIPIEVKKPPEFPTTSTYLPTFHHGAENLRLLGYLSSMAEAPKRLLNCLRHPVSRDVKPTLLRYKAFDGSPSISFRGMQRCELWCCPVCAPSKARVLQRRMDQKVRELKENNLYFATATISHSLTDPLSAVYGDLVKAWSRFVLRPTYKKLFRKHRFKIHFWVRELEYGVSGWHPHLHMYLEFSGELAQLQAELAICWQEACKEVGRSVNLERGFYVSKFRDSSSLYVLKQWLAIGKNEQADRLTPLELGFSASLTGDREHQRLYKEYLQFSKTHGRHKQFFLSGVHDEYVPFSREIDDGRNGGTPLSRDDLIEIREQGVWEFLRRKM